MARQKKSPSRREIRRLRIQQILFVILAAMIILVMVIGLFAKI